jgi:hypothetical protein
VKGKSDTFRAAVVHAVVVQSEVMAVAHVAGDLVRLGRMARVHRNGPAMPPSIHPSIQAGRQRGHRPFAHCTCEGAASRGAQACA